jgi:hypothetical protein
MKYTLKHHKRTSEFYSVKQQGWVKETQEADVEVYLDIDRIVREIADEAIHNRTGRSRNLSGLIQAKVLQRYPREPEFRPWPPSAEKVK